MNILVLFSIHIIVKTRMYRTVIRFETKRLKIQNVATHAESARRVTYGGQNEKGRIWKYASDIFQTEGSIMLFGALSKVVLVVGLVEVDLSPFPFGLLYWTIYL